MATIPADFWAWIWSTVLWWSTWNVAVVLVFLWGVYQTLTGKRSSNRVVGIILIALSLTVSLFHSWREQYIIANREHAQLKEYDARITTAITISQSWVMPEHDPRKAYFWIPAPVNSHGKVRLAACIPGVVLLLRVRNIHDFPVSLDHISRATFVYVGGTFNLDYDMKWPLYNGFNPAQGLRRVEKTLRDIGMIQPHDYADGLISFSYPFLTTVQPDRIDISFVDSGGSTLPVHWDRNNAADISFSMLQIPDVPLDKTVVKYQAVCDFIGGGR
ncbi:MAG TPA: hypothetical protein VFE16_07535 [Candidatus Cybelea sp.]|jgi:hypothetical protein|nr:hypothetical protein [Candidatus Cybelea sp.]